MEISAVPTKNIRHAANASISDTSCQSQIASSSLSVEACADKESMVGWWYLIGFSDAMDLLQSISTAFSGLQSVSICGWQGRITIWCLLHFVHVTQSSTLESQYSWCLQWPEAKLSGIKVANNTSSNDEAIKFDLRFVAGRFLAFLWWRLMKQDRLADSSSVFCNDENKCYNIVRQRVNDGHKWTICGWRAPPKPQKVVTGSEINFYCWIVLMINKFIQFQS